MTDPIYSEVESSIVWHGALLTYFGEHPEVPPEPGHPFYDWFQDTLPHNWAALRNRALAEHGQAVFDQMVMEGRAVPYTLDDGTTGYRAVEQ